MQNMTLVGGRVEDCPSQISVLTQDDRTHAEQKEASEDDALVCFLPIKQL